MPVNEDGNIVLYHATSVEGAASIRKNGVDLLHVNRDMDFGRGFYTTTDFEQAKAWAAKRHNGGAIVTFEISPDELNQLNNKFFATTDSAWMDAVVAGRKGVQPAYDTVSGIMLKNVNAAVSGKALPIGSGQQTTFLSDKAIALLNKGLKK